MNKQLHRFEGMNLVKEEYVDRGVTDTMFAIYASEKLNRLYSHAHIRQYRQVLEIPNSEASGRTPRLPTIVYVVATSDVAGVYLSRQAAEEATVYEDSMSVYEIRLLR